MIKFILTSNQNTGNITCGRSLNRYSMPSIFLRSTLIWSLISTLTGIEDSGSTQKLDPCLSASGLIPYWNWPR